MEYQKARNWLIERHMLVSLIFVNVDALTSTPCGVGDVSVPWQPEQSYIILCGSKFSINFSTHCILHVWEIKLFHQHCALYRKGRLRICTCTYRVGSALAERVRLRAVMGSPIVLKMTASVLGSRKPLVGTI